jgi:hypothetical protein
VSAQSLQLRWWLASLLLGTNFVHLTVTLCKLFEKRVQPRPSQRAGENRAFGLHAMQYMSDDAVLFRCASPT